MTSMFALAATVFGSLFRGKRALVLENLALREQLAVYKRVQKHPRLRSSDRAFWVWLSRLWDRWEAPLILVRPETVIRWHRQGFKLYWRWRSRAKRPGRPRIPPEHIEFIRRISRDHPIWGEDKIDEELRVKFGVSHSTSTIRKYMVRPRSRDDGQKWRTFIKNHSHELFACDFMTQYTALFTTAYVFVVMEISTRRIVLCNVTERPTLDWVKIQIRDIAAFDRKPRFLLHDNDGVFGQFGRQRDGSRCHLDRWLSVTMDIEGLPTPYRPRMQTRTSRDFIVRYAKTRSTTSSSSTPAMFGVWPGTSSNTTTGRALHKGGSAASEYTPSPSPIPSCSRDRRPAAN